MIVEIGLLQNFLLALGIVSFVVIVAFIAIKLLKKHKEIEKTEPNLSTGYKKLLKTANKHAKNVLTQTTIEAANIITGARATNEKLEENLDHVLQGIAQKDIQTLKDTTTNQEKNYQAHLQEIDTKVEELTNDIIENTKKAYDEKLDKFTKDLLLGGLSTQETVDKKTAELLNAAQIEIEEYKKSQFGKIDSDAQKMLEKVYKDVLRVTIPESLHKELILKSLEDAKRDGIFNF